MSFVGEREPRGKGMFAACSVGSSSTPGLTPLMLASRDFRGLVEPLITGLSCKYGWCRYQALPEAVPLHPGGDHGPLDTESAPASELSDRKPEWCEGKRKPGEGLSLFSKSSNEAESEGCVSNIWSSAPILVAVAMNSCALQLTRYSGSRRALLDGTEADIKEE